MVTKCECLECIKAEHYQQQFSRFGDAIVADNLEDNLTGKADEFIGGELIAAKKVIVYESPGGMYVEEKTPGEKIGVIYSYVNKDGNLWWMLENGNFVKHVAGNFNADSLQQSLNQNERVKQAAIDAKVQARKDANENPLYNLGESFLSFGNTLKWVIIGIVVLVGAALAYKMLK